MTVQHVHEEKSLEIEFEPLLITCLYCEMLRDIWLLPSLWYSDFADLIWVRLNIIMIEVIWLLRAICSSCIIFDFILQPRCLRLLCLSDLACFIHARNTIFCQFEFVFRCAMITSLELDLCQNKRSEE